jgi:hypothetical protein
MTHLPGAGLARGLWELAWKRAMPMFPNEWSKGLWPEPRDTVDIVTLPASHRYYRLLDLAARKYTGDGTVIRL